MLCIFYVVLNVICFCNAYRFGPYHADPDSIRNMPNAYPGKLESDFFLQQKTKDLCLVRGTLDVKEDTGPLKSNVEIQLWAGDGFKKTSGNSNNFNFHIEDACKDNRSMDVLFYFEPKVVNYDSCIFPKGHYEMTCDFNELMHFRNQMYAYDPLSFTMNFTDKFQRTLFGFALELTITDLELYNYAHETK